MSRTWTIVVFPGENSVEAVPSTWLIGSVNKCYWPAYPAPKLTAAIRNHEAPNTCWPSYNVTLLRNGTFGMFHITIYVVTF